MPCPHGIMKGYSKAAAHKGKVAYRTPSRMRPVNLKPMNKGRVPLKGLGNKFSNVL